MSVMPPMPSCSTSAKVTRLWKAIEERIAILAAASLPLTSSVGSASAKPSSWAFFRVGAYSAPLCAMAERM